MNDASKAVGAKRWRTALQRVEQRIDGLSLRERAFVFISAAGLLLAAADQAVIADSLKAQTGWKAAQLREENDLLQLRTELSKLSRQAPGPHSDRGMNKPTGPNAAYPQDLQAELLAARADYDAALALTQPVAQGAAPAALSDLLARALQQQRGLTLVQLSTRPSNPGKAGAATATATAGANATNATNATNANLPLAAWQSASLSVAGSFADLRSFVAQLETSLPGLRWGTLTLDTASGTPMMTLNLWLNERTP